MESGNISATFRIFVSVMLYCFLAIVNVSRLRMDKFLLISKETNYQEKLKIRSKVELTLLSTVKI